ncbi:MAG TPA: hypothetical protein DCE09_08290 [Thermoanaerobacter sp.]|nr:hypothetical protein [Thermoanaerobacter sp.]
MLKGVLEINDYKPFKQAQESLEKVKSEVAKLENNLKKAKAEAQVLEEEAVRIAVLVEMGEAENKAVTEAEKKAAIAKKTVQELEEAVRRKKIELQVKAELVKQKEAEARKMIADNLRNAHKEAVRKLAKLLSQAVEVNQQVREIQEYWHRLNLNNGKFDGLPGTLPGMHWEELLPGGQAGGAIVDTKYSLWIKELKAYGYTD